MNSKRCFVNYCVVFIQTIAFRPTFVRNSLLFAGTSSPANDRPPVTIKSKQGIYSAGRKSTRWSRFGMQLDGLINLVPVRSGGMSIFTCFILENPVWSSVLTAEWWAGSPRDGAAVNTKVEQMAPMLGLFWILKKFSRPVFMILSIIP